MDPQKTDRTGPLLTDRVAVVTGGGGGIGRAASRTLAIHGAEIVIAEIDAARAEETAEEIRRAGGKASVVVVDVRRREEVEELQRIVLDRHEHVDVVVNNVGHWVRHVGDFIDGDTEFWSDLHSVNFWHVLLVTHAFLSSMVARRSGSIINVSSVEGMRGYPHDPVYGAYKAAVIQFTRSLAVQVGHTGVRVNGIAPDVTESIQVPYASVLPPDQQVLWPQWVPVGRMGIPEDQARVILFLASDLSAFVTGHTIPTDGGTAAAGGWFRSLSRKGRWTNRPIDP